MIFQTRECTRIICRAFATGAFVVDRGKCVFPTCPSPCKPGFQHQITGKQSLVIGRDQVVVFIFGHKPGEPLPKVRPELPGPATIEPLQLCLRHQEHTAQHQICGPFRMRLRIDQRKRRAPATAKDDPLFNAKRFTNRLDIADQMPGRIRLNARMGSGSTAAAPM